MTLKRVLQRALETGKAFYRVSDCIDPKRPYSVFRLDWQRRVFMHAVRDGGGFTDGDLGWTTDDILATDWRLYNRRPTEAMISSMNLWRGAPSP